jgi:DNA replication ATP-dependent helicase Dna2
VEYKFGKRALSQYIRTGCQRRLRLDLINESKGEKEVAPPKDSMRPGLTLLAQMGRAFEREKFKELEEVFPDRMIRGEITTADPENRVFEVIELRDCIDRLGERSFALEVSYEVVEAFKRQHRVGSRDVRCGSTPRRLWFSEISAPTSSPPFRTAGIRAE